MRRGLGEKSNRRCNRKRLGAVMDKTEFSHIRRHLGKTRETNGPALGYLSQSHPELGQEGWRNIPVSAERQVLFLMALKSSQNKKASPCWSIRRCSEKTRQQCPAWEFQAGHVCWFINGTICRGKVQESWDEKMNVCRQCTVFVRLSSPSETGDFANNLCGVCP